MPRDVALRFISADLDVRQYPVAVVGESNLQLVIEDLHGRITEAATLRTQTDVTSIARCGSHYQLSLSAAGESFQVTSPKVVLATGRRGISRMQGLLSELDVQVNAPSPSIGVRFEMAAELLAEIGSQHPDLKITQFVGPLDEKVKTFCFCGGSNGGRIKFTRYFDAFGADIITLDGHETVERMAGSRGLAANFGLLCQLRGERKITDFIQEYVTSFAGRPAAQAMGDFFGRRLTMPSWHALRASMPYELSVQDLQLGRVDLLFRDSELSALQAGFENVMSPILEALPGVDIDDLASQVLVVAPEIEFFWDEVVLTASCETTAPGLFVVGDAAGIAQGAVQAAMMGHAAARAVAADAMAA